MASALKQAKELAEYNNKLEQGNVEQQYNYNKALAEQDRDWQERMSNSAHQREIADLKAAGLNPVLSITGGNGASTPSGSSASVSKANVDMSLPAKVMDMAMAQLNSATALQTVAMQNANALQLAYNQHGYKLIEIHAQGQEDRDTKEVTSGDTISGQIGNWQRFLEKAGAGYERLDNYIYKKTGYSAKSESKKIKQKLGTKKGSIRRGYRYWQKKADQTQLQTLKLRIAGGEKLRGKDKRIYKRLLRKYS